MKWLPHNKGFNNQKIDRSNYASSLVGVTSHAAKIIFCFICTGMFLSGDGDRLKVTIASISPQKLATKVNQVASDISVRILDQNFLGSGFIVQQTNQEYIVITNQHVLRAGEAPYSIETVDGKTYLAEVITDMNTSDYQYDLAILKFKADTAYTTAKIGKSFNLEVGEPVFAAGFPYQEAKPEKVPAIFAESNVISSRELALKGGRVAIILNQALEEGYQIGYTNDVKKGMSGGPLLNSQGEVIGINGKHAYPLWESPEIYQDGSEPCPALQELITRSSLAIPIEKSIELNNQLKSLKSPVIVEYPVESSLSTEDSEVVAQMKAVAEETQRKCREDAPRLNESDQIEDVLE